MEKPNFDLSAASLEEGIKGSSKLLFVQPKLPYPTPPSHLTTKTTPPHSPFDNQNYPTSSPIWQPKLPHPTPIWQPKLPHPTPHLTTKTTPTHDLHLPTILLICKQNLGAVLNILILQEYILKGVVNAALGQDQGSVS